MKKRNQEFIQKEDFHTWYKKSSPKWTKENSPKWTKENSQMDAHLTDALNLFSVDEIRHLGEDKYEGIRHNDGRTIRMIAYKGSGCTEYDTDLKTFDEMWKKGGLKKVLQWASILGMLRDKNEDHSRKCRKKIKKEKEEDNTKNKEQWPC